MAIDGTISRRGLFSGTFAALAGGYIGLRPADAATRGQAEFLTAARIAGADGGALMNERGLMPFALPARAHAPLRLDRERIALIGRRPGSFGAIADLAALAEGEAPHLFTPTAGRRFAGHAAVSPDGRTLATSEIDAETGAGAVVVRDAANAAPKQVFAAGIEPHDLLFARGGERLIVAIGGIAQAADVKGPAMNAGNIDSCILELDPRTGAVVRRHALPSDMRSLSLRHMALAADGETIAFGMQDQDRSRQRPLMGLLRVGRGIELLPLPAEEGVLRSYVGSVVIDASNRFVAATSPKGGLVGLWRLSDGKALSGFALADVCGLAAGDAPGTFWATSGHGDVVQIEAGDAGFTARNHWRAAAAFDNHLLRI
jgi:hypothetical protein